MFTSQEPSKNNIIAIASGKGGVGKTWLSITLAHLFTRSGRRILLIDGDIGLANVDVQLGIAPTKDLTDVLRHQLPLKDAITHYHVGFDVIAGRSGSTSLANLSPEKLLTLKKDIHNIAHHYDYVILDLGAGIEHYVQFLASLAARCVVVLTDEPTSLTDAYAFVKLCSTKLNKTELSVVVNQAATQKDGERAYDALNKACSNFLGTSPSLLGVIRRDNKVRDAIRAQSPLVEKSPHTTAATDAAAISIKLLQRMCVPVSG
ncbi:MAG: cobyrinic acid a,c-diamide synthase [Alphaproteobacteria bacterium]|nr:MAG: cobyrinic acid a,c-diamide synthase [Alphaproteobacteria bacterium]